MPNSENSAHSNRLNFLFCILSTLIFIQDNYSQTIPSAFKKKVDSLITAAPKTYEEIDKVLKEFNGYILIKGISYRVSKAKADECVKRGIAIYK